MSFLGGPMSCDRGQYAHEASPQWNSIHSVSRKRGRVFSDLRIPFCFRVHGVPGTDIVFFVLRRSMTVQYPVFWKPITVIGLQVACGVFLRITRHPFVGGSC